VDPEAREAYRLRLEDLDDEVEVARRLSDPERAARAIAERDAIGAHLAAATGLAGRDRRAGDGAERARVNVTRALARALRGITRADPSIGRHLSAAISTGMFCVYAPPASELVTWEVASGGRHTP
jgi:hypothetical protein